jgi:membrane protease YdiL (CAAX protease family)
VASRFADEKADFNPRSWLSKYRRNSIGYITKMLLFYHGIGILLLLMGSYIIEQTIPNYKEPDIPRSLSGVITAGPIEETVFFGIPFYVVGNTYFVLVTGALWAGIHLLNGGNLTVNSLAFGNLLFVLPSLFFSLRTWASGKGWFSIIVHSTWNAIFFAAGCVTADFTCTMTDNDISSTMMSVLLSTCLLVGTYLLYRRSESKQRQRLAV